MKNCLKNPPIPGLIKVIIGEEGLRKKGKREGPALECLEKTKNS